MTEKHPIMLECGAEGKALSQDELAIEGYRLTGDETLAFAHAAWPLVRELDWVWNEAS